MTDSPKVTLEIVEHYPTIIPIFDYEGNVVKEIADPNSGTFRTYWVEMKMDLLGCKYIFKSPTNTFVMLPSIKAYDKAVKHYITFPAISFMEHDLNLMLQNTLFEAFKKYAADHYMVYDPKRISRKQRFYKPRSQEKPSKGSQIKPTGTFRNFVDFKDLQSKRYLGDK